MFYIHNPRVTLPELAACRLGIDVLDGKPGSAPLTTGGSPCGIIICDLDKGVLVWTASEPVGIQECKERLAIS